MTRARAFRQVDVFTDIPLAGNPVAVVLDAVGLTTEQMQRFTDWTNLSEATFVGPASDPRADYAVRIFTSGRELPFAGHPTLGTCHAWLEAGGRPAADGVVVQECGAGLVPVRRDAATGRLAFAAPELARGGPLGADDLAVVTAGLGLSPDEVLGHQWCDNGPPWQAVRVASAERVLAVEPDAAVLAGRFVGVVGPHDPGAVLGADVEVRAFFPGVRGLGEDPVTGSLNAAIGQWFAADAAGRAADAEASDFAAALLASGGYVARQGTRVGRDGRVAVEVVSGGGPSSGGRSSGGRSPGDGAPSGPQVWVGGRSVTILEGVARL